MVESNAGFFECGDESVEAGRGPGQLPWYEFALRFVMGKSVLDSGCGLGQGLEILKRGAARVQGHDLDPRLASDDILIGSIEEIAAKSFDVVLSIDVIEHVENPEVFIGHLARIARKGLFLTTPNCTASRCKWPYHRREYTPREFEQLLAPFGAVSLYKGTPSGSEVFSINHKTMYYCFNEFRVSPLSAFPAQCWNHLIPRSWRIHSHNAAWVEIT